MESTDGRIYDQCRRRDTGSQAKDTPNEFVNNARIAEEVGFTTAMICDHFHPWVRQQANGPFTWIVIGGIAHATHKLSLGTGITCPLVRYRPGIIVAQVAAIAATMMPGRFFLGVGTGKALNEHIAGEQWPTYSLRLQMLEEAARVLRLLFRSGLQGHHGRYFTVEEAQIHSLPNHPIPILVAAQGKESADPAGFKFYKREIFPRLAGIGMSVE